MSSSIYSNLQLELFLYFANRSWNSDDTGRRGCLRVPTEFDAAEISHHPPACHWWVLPTCTWIPRTVRVIMIIIMSHCCYSSIRSSIYKKYRVFLSEVESDETDGFRRPPIPLPSFLPSSSTPLPLLVLLIKTLKRRHAVLWTLPPRLIASL